MVAHTLSRFSHIQLFTALWMVARQASLFVRFSRQEYWSGLPCPPPGDLPNPGTELMSPVSPALAGRKNPNYTMASSGRNHLHLVITIMVNNGSEIEQCHIAPDMLPWEGLSSPMQFSSVTKLLHIFVRKHQTDTSEGNSL